MPPVRRRKALRYPPDNPLYKNLTLPQKQYAWAQFNEGRKNRDLPLVWPEYAHGTETATHKPPGWRNISDDYPRISNWRYLRERNTALNNRDLTDAFETQRNRNYVRPTEPEDDEELIGVIDQLDALANDNTSSSTESNKRKNYPEDIERLEGFEGVAGPSDAKRPRIIGPPDTTTAAPTTTTTTASPETSTMSNNMDTDAPAPRVKKQKTSDGGFDAASGPVTLLQKPVYDYSAGTVSFTKIHHMRSWALPFIPVIVGNSKYVTTPLMEIPWNRMMFYMSQEEFDLLPAHSHVLNCHTSITHLSCQTSFETGQTTATTSTTNNAKILVTGFDLEAKCRGGRSMKVTIGSNMVPSDLLAADYDDFIEKQYGSKQVADDWDTSIAGCNHAIPYYSNNYFCTRNLSNTGALGKFTEADAPGEENFIGYITQMNASDVAWTTIFDRDYTFSSAPIGGPILPLEIHMENFTQIAGSTEKYCLMKTRTGLTASGYVDDSNTLTSNSTSTVSTPKVTYTDLIEQGGLVVEHGMNRKDARQPTIHVGMRAIDKLKSNLNTSRADAFVQSNAYFVVTATITVKLPGRPNKFTRPSKFAITVEGASTHIQYKHINHNSVNQFVTNGQYNVEPIT